MAILAILSPVLALGFVLLLQVLESWALGDGSSPSTPSAAAATQSSDPHPPGGSPTR